MRQPVRSFAIGLFTAGIVMLIGLSIFDNDEDKQVAELSADTMIPLIEEQGYRVVTEEEYIAVSVNKDKENNNNEDKSDPDKVEEKDDKDTDKEVKEKDEKETASKKKEKDDKDKNKDKDKDKKDDVKTYTVHIEEGVLSSTISNTLEANDIIDNATKFNLYLTDNGYGEKIQLGKFKVNSDMSFKEIAEAITK